MLDRLAALLIEKETVEAEEFESLFEGVLPPRAGGPTPRRILDEPIETPEPDAEGAEGTDADRRRRPGPAPQPA